VATPDTGSRFACPRTVRPDLAAQTRRALNLDPDQPVPRCWTWPCPGCRYLRCWGVRRFILAGALEAALRDDAVVFWTLTERRHPRNPRASSAGLTRFFDREVKDARAVGVAPLRYVAVAEYQARGAIHWHGLASMSGEARSLGAFRTDRALHDRAWAAGFGHQADAQDLSDHQDLARRAGYCSKYLEKSLAQPVHNAGKPLRRVRSSQGSRRWYSRATCGAVTRAWRETQAHVLLMRTALDFGVTVAAA
jgi:hypothetical protein